MVKLFSHNTTSKIVLLYFMLISNNVFCQDILWEKSYGGIQAEYLMDAVPTADYGFILAGSSLSSKSGNKTSLNEGDLDYWVWKMDEKGEMEWQKSFGGSNSDFLNSIKLTTDGGFILAGNSNSAKSGQKNTDGHGNYDFWIIKLNAGGGEEWQQTIGGSGDEKLNAVFQTKDGGFILGGSSTSERSFDKASKNYGNMDYWVVKLDKTGKIKWEKTFGGKYFDELRSIEQTTDNGYIVAGYSNSPKSESKSENNIGIGDYWILKLDNDGKVEWERTIGGDKDDQLYTVHQTHDGGYILGGNSNSEASFGKRKSNGKGTDFWVIKLNENGIDEWQETYDFGYADILTSIVESKDHTFLIGGYTQSDISKSKDDKGINDYIALKISEKGEILWDTSVGSSGDDALQKLIETRDGGYILAGTSSPERTANQYNTQKQKNLSGKPSVTIGDGQDNQPVKKNAVNEQINETTNAINEAYSETADKVTSKINKTIDLGDSPVKAGINKPQDPILKSPTVGGGSENMLGGLMDNLSNGKSNLPASGDKKSNFGTTDFWVVKLKDKQKEKHEKSQGLEAMPNPTEGFTNVIINYEFDSGTATVADISGHVLAQFPITSHTVPVDLSGYPEGMYIINIKTNMGSNGVKVIKKGK